MELRVIGGAELSERVVFESTFAHTFPAVPFALFRSLQRAVREFNLERDYGEGRLAVDWQF
jgi:hypothetical protein